MAAANGNGGGEGLPFNIHEEEEEEEKEEEEIGIGGVIKKNISIAERRAAKCGFNVSNIINEATALVRSPYFTIPPGISPSALLDSPIMLPNSQAQLSPTTGTFQFPTPNPNPETLNPKLKLQNKLFEEFEYQNMGMKDKFHGKTEVLGVGEEEDNLQPNSSKEKQHPKEIAAAKYSEDGYYWRKYGQKHVKGSEFPRSYYKCTNTNCPVKKKVERSHDGQITEIVYKGSHNHSKPADQSSFKQGSSTGSFIKHEAHDNGLDVTSLFNDPLSTTFESQDQFSSTFNDQDEASPESISINDEDDDNNGEYYEPKRRKKDSFPNEIANPRSTREPRVVVQIESDIDILDDGYRWRKYGQKVVKGNPNPRSYYKCTTPGCPVRKHVERAANDIKSVVTTYEGKHNHEVPCSSKSGGSLLVISDNVANPNLPPNSSTTPSPITHKQEDAMMTKPMQDHHQQQQLPLYKPLLSYDELMRSNFNFGAAASSSIYPLSFPPFQSLPYMMNANHNHNHMKRYPPSSNLYPMLPDYMPSINHHGSAAAAAANVPPGNFHFGNHSTLPPNSISVRGKLEIRSECQSRNKEEKRDVLYDGYPPNHGNGTM